MDGSPLRRFGLFFLMALLLAAAGCSSASSGSGSRQTVAQTPPACKPLPASDVPEASGQLTDADGPGPYCLAVGRSMTVFLKVAVTATATWAPLQVSDTAVLQARPAGFLTLVRGVTAGFFAAVKPGVAKLSSEVPGSRSWSATVVVQAR